MEIDLKDAPDVLFDQLAWRRFCTQFDHKESALAAISRPPFGRYGYHGDSEDGVAASAEDRAAHAEVTFKLGNELVGAFKKSLVSGALGSSGILFRLQYQRGEQEPVKIAGEEWARLWPEFADNRAFGDARYEHVRISWDARKPETEALEDIILGWLLNDCIDAHLRKKEQLRADACRRFGKVPVRVFNRSYGRAFNRQRGAPRRPK